MSSIGFGTHTLKWLTGTGRVLVVALMFAASGLPRAARVGDGGLDPTFGRSGKVKTDFSGRADGARALLLQPDGKIVAGGVTQIPGGKLAFALARYNIDGSLDTAFGKAGKTVTDVGRGGGVSSLALLADGKILAAGAATGGGDDLALVCYERDGSLDRTFANGGIVMTDFGSSEIAFALAIQPDGRILLAGMAGRGNRGCSSLIVARYEKSGRLDSSFCRGGRATVEFSACGYDEALAVALQPDGKIVLVGRADLNSATSAAVIVRLNGDGSADQSFGEKGKVSVNFLGHKNQLNAIALQRDGKIVVAGWAGRGFESAEVLLLARYNSDGSLDKSFGRGGTLTNDFSGRGGEARALALQSDGKIVVAGMAGFLRAPTPNADFAVARYNGDGSPDESFGSRFDTTFGSYPFHRATVTDLSDVIEYASAVVLQRDGKIVLAGYTGDERTRGDFALVRYNVER